MKTGLRILSLSFVISLTAGCAGVTVVKPQEKNKNAGTLALDMSDGHPKFVATYTCNLESLGNRFSAIGKSEDEARKEVTARCRDKTIISFCKPEKATCMKN